jgi:hypothetical protein
MIKADNNRPGFYRGDPAENTIEPGYKAGYFIGF